MSDKSVQNFPLISVVIPLYNGELWIKDSLLSVSNQSYENIEVVVIDDGSTDNSIKVVDQTAAMGFKYPLRLYRGENNGVSSARNRGIKESHGELIAFLDSDDVWKPEKLSLQLGYLLTHPDSIAVICDFYISKLDRHGILKNRRLISKRGVQSVGKKWLNLEGNGALLSSTILLWKHKFENVVVFDRHLGTAADLNFYLKLCELGEVGYIQAPLVQYRQHNNQMHTKPDLLKTDFIYLLDEMASFPKGLSREKILGNVYVMSSILNFSKGRFLDAFRDFKFGFYLRPTSTLRIPISVLYKRIDGYLRLIYQNRD